MEIIKAEEKHLSDIAKIGSENFSGLKGAGTAEKWIQANFSAFPVNQYFVAVEKGIVSGYVLWMEKGGFRKESVWEMVQIAVSKNYQGQGIGTKLIMESLSEIKKYLNKRGAALKLVEVTTGTDNRAQDLYKKTLGAEPECVIKDFFRGDEVMMIARFT